jgi:hypothetical protein
MVLKRGTVVKVKRVYKLIFGIFNFTVGKVVRLFQSTLILRNEPPGILFLIEQHFLQDSANYAVHNFSKAIQFRQKTELWSFCLKRSSLLQIPNAGIIAEFGVWKGESINFFARNCPHAKVFGFDSFEGLEEDWYGYTAQKGTFSTNGQLPKCAKNVQLIIG